MKIIKFRAWYYNQIWYSDFTISGNGDINWWNPEREEYYMIPKEDVKLMQFTGKKDKNGKEIYEGDIIKVKDHPDFPAWGGVGFVFWDNEEQSYFYGVEGGWSDLLCTPEEKQLEVIGNKFENPELLEETK